MGTHICGCGRQYATACYDTGLCYDCEVKKHIYEGRSLLWFPCAEWLIAELNFKMKVAKWLVAEALED